jgi:hypothetical protein
MGGQGGFGRWARSSMLRMMEGKMCRSVEDEGAFSKERAFFHGL